VKYTKPRKDLMFILNPLVIILGIILFCYLPHVVSACFYLFWLSIACALFLILSPFGNKRLAQNAEDAVIRLPKLQWFVCILLLELGLYGIYCGISLLNGDVFLINGSAQSHLFSHSLKMQLLHYGLFPWSLYALIAIGMGVLGYCKQTDAYFSNLLKPFTKQGPQETLGLIVNNIARSSTLFGLSITLLFFIFLLLSFVISPEIQLNIGFKTAALLTTLLLLVASFTNTAKQRVKRLFSNRISTTVSFPLFCVVLAILILVLNIISTTLSSNTPTQSEPAIIARWIAYNRHTAWSFFSIVWWICLAPIVCGFIARVSKGYKIRDILLCVLAFPILLCVFFIVSRDFNFSSIAVSLLTLKIVSLISFLIVLPLLVNHANAPMMILAYFPKNGAPKPRDQQPFFLKLSRLTVVATYFYLVVGINGISLLIFVPNFAAIFSVLIALLAILRMITT